MRPKIEFTLTLSLAFALSLGSATALAQSKRSQERAEERPRSLPQKTTPTKRTFLDFSKDDTTVISRPLSPIDRALVQSANDVQAANKPTQVRSRRIVPAPQGDLAEPVAAYAAKPAPTPAPKATPARAMAQPSTLPEKPTPVAVNTPTPTPIAESRVELEKPLTIVEASPDLKIETAQIPTPPPTPTPIPREPSPVSPIVTVEKSSIAPTATSEGFLKSIDEETMAFVRTGYYTANYKKFDDRMNNGANLLGIGIARGAETSWGSFEARAAFDMYHAMDQSVTVDNIRMISVRTELAYWLSRSRVKPGVSLGLGWADYSIRSYRSVSGSNEETVTLRTHAKGRAFSVIPATSLRIELSKGLVVDVQTEFLALLGGNSADTAQGLGVNVGLGWIF